MSEAEFFHQPDYPVPGHGKAWFAPTSDGARLRLASWHPTVRPEKGTVLVAQGRAEFIERYSETIADLRRRGFHVLTFDWRGQGGSQRFTARQRRGHVGKLVHYERDLALVIAQMQERMPKPHFALAHSMGAALFLDAARHGALPVSRLVAVAPMLGLTIIENPAAARLLANMPVTVELSSPPLRKVPVRAPGWQWAIARSIVGNTWLSSAATELDSTRAKSGVQ